MKLTILQKKLKEGINAVERLSTNILSLPILGNILLKTEKNFLKLSTTDLEIGINWWILTKIETEGEITIPSKILSNFIGLLPDEKINIEKEGLNLNIDCDNYKTKLKGISSKDFPIIPKIEEGKHISIKNSLLCEGLSQVVDIALPSTTKPEISGICFSFYKNSIKIAATDSFRLGEKTIPIKKSSPDLAEGESLILPQKAAKEIISIFGSREKGDISIRFSSNQILFELKMEEIDHVQTQLISRLIDGEYPNYQEIIPEKYKTSVIFSKSEMLNQIKTASLFSDKINEIKIKVDPKEKKVDLLSRNVDTGEYHSSLSAEIEGKPCVISFNHRFLINGLTNIRSSKIKLELNGSEGAAVLRPVEDENYIYVVMPIKAN